MVEAARLPGLDGKTLTGRHRGKIRRRDPPGRPCGVGEKAFFRVARGLFYVTTGINFEKWEKGAEIRRLEGTSSHI